MMANLVTGELRNVFECGEPNRGYFWEEKLIEKKKMEKKK